MFSLKPIGHRRYGFVMLLAMGLLVIVVTNFPIFMQVVMKVVNCQVGDSSCDRMASEISDYVSLAMIVLFLTITAVATFRRVRDTAISNYWVVFLSVLIFLDHAYLTGLGRVWSGELNQGILEVSIPWFLMAAASLVLLLTFATAKSSYFMDGYWNADPPLGYGLSISSFWLLSYSATRALMVFTDATGNRALMLTTERIQHQFEEVLPLVLVSPVVPAVIFTTCALLLTVIGMTKKAIAGGNQPASMRRRQEAVHVTRAARHLNGYKF